MEIGLNALFANAAEVPSLGIGSNARPAVAAREISPAPVSSEGVVVNIGIRTPAPQLYNADGLLRSLLHLDAGQGPGGGTPPSSAQTQLQNDLSTLLGINIDTTSNGIRNPSGSLATLSADTVQALNNILTTDISIGGGDANQALSNLLSQASSFSSTGLDTTTAAASVLNAAGIFQTSSTASTKALASVLGTNLGLVATALNSSISDAAERANNSLLSLSQSSSSSASFGSVLAANVQVATASLAANSLPQGTDTTSNEQALIDVLLSNLNLSSVAAGSAASSPAVQASESGTSTIAAATTSGSPEAATPQALTVLPVTIPTVSTAAVSRIAAPAQQASVSRAIERSVDIGSPASLPLRAALTTEPPVTTTSDSAGARLQALIGDPSARAAALIARDPGYAATAAALYMSSAMFRFQNDEAATAAVARDMRSRPIAGIEGIRPLGSV